MPDSMRTAMIAALLALALATPLASAQTGIATVNFNDQESDGTSVFVESASLSNGGFIVIHDDTLQNDTMGSIVGVSDYLGPGVHNDITVNLTATLQGNVTLVAMPHFDSNDNQTYDFESSNGTEDGPYTDGGAAVTDEATVNFDSSDDDGRTGDDDDGDARGAPGLGWILVTGVVVALAAMRRRS